MAETVSTQTASDLGQARDKFNVATRSRGLVERGYATLYHGSVRVISQNAGPYSFFELLYRPGGISGIPGYLVTEDVLEGDSFTIRSSSYGDNSDVVYIHYYRDVDGG